MVEERSAGPAGSNQLSEDCGGQQQLLRAGRGSGLSALKYKGALGLGIKFFPQLREFEETHSLIVTITLINSWACET